MPVAKTSLEGLSQISYFFIFFWPIGFPLPHQNAPCARTEAGASPLCSPPRLIVAAASFMLLSLGVFLFFILVPDGRKRSGVSRELVRQRFLDGRSGSDQEQGQHSASMALRKKSKTASERMPACPCLRKSLMFNGQGFYGRSIV